MRQTLGSKIKAERKQQGLSQQRLAGLANVSLATLQNIEAGRANPAISTVEGLLRVLGLGMNISSQTIDWVLLSALGAPLMSVGAYEVMPHRSLLLTALRPLSSQLKEIKKESREELALCAFLVAIRDHYSSVWEELAESLRKWVQVRSARLPLGKLRRLALYKLGEYL